MITDDWSPDDAMGRIRYQREDLSLGIEFSPFTTGIQNRTVNNLPPEQPRLHVSDGPDIRAPWL